MTENEAIKRIKECMNTPNFQPYHYMNEAFEIAIQALEEIQQYRAIGTVEGYERAIQSSIENYNLYREYKAKVQEFEAIGTVEEFKALKEKSEPSKVIEHETPHFVHWQCDNCGAEFYSGQKFCDECGHPADWGELLK